MEIRKEQNGTTMVIYVTGRLESLTSPQLEVEVKGVPDAITELILDLTAMEYTSSAGLRVILTGHKLMKARGGIMKLRGVNDSVKKLFDLTAFTPILTFV